LQRINDKFDKTSSKSILIALWNRWSFGWSWRNEWCRTSRKKEFLKTNHIFDRKKEQRETRSREKNRRCANKNKE